jgi:glutathione S-transferase
MFTWLLGETFSAADILFVSLLQFGRELMPPYPEFDAWLARAVARPALARARPRTTPSRLTGTGGLIGFPEQR